MKKILLLSPLLLVFLCPPVHAQGGGNNTFQYNCSGSFCGDANFQFRPSDSTVHSLASLYRCGPGPAIDVDCETYGAVGDAQTVSDGAMTSGSATLTSASGNFAAGDVGKAISVNMAPVQQPAQPTVTVNTSGGTIPCVQAPSPTQIFVRVTESNSNGEGLPSIEGNRNCNIAGSSNQVVVTSPSALNGATTYNVYALTISGSTELQSACTNVSIGTNCTLNSIGTGAHPPTFTPLITTIKTFNSATSVTLNANATQTVSNAKVAWGTDNKTPIQNALNSLPTTGSVGGTIYLQNKAYFISGPLSLTTGGAGNLIIRTAGSKGWDGANGAEIWMAATGYVLTLLPSTAGSNVQGPEIYGLTCRDVSGAGVVTGCFHLQEAAHVFLDKIGGQDIANGTLVFFDSIRPATDSQYNMIIDPFCHNCGQGIVFGAGQHSNNWIIGGVLDSSQTGNNICIDFQQNGGSLAGGSNHVDGTACELWTLAAHFGDSSGDTIDHFHAENTATNQLGTGVLIDGTSTTGCHDEKISNVSIVTFSLGLSLGSNCTNIFRSGITYSTNIVDVADSATLSGTEYDAAVTTVDFNASGSAGLSAGQAVKLDSSNNNSVIKMATTDTGGGIFVGIAMNSPVQNQTARIAVSGVVNTPVVGTGTCSRGNFVIADTTTSGRVQCTGTFTAGTVFGKATAGSGVGVGSSISMFLQVE